MQTRREHHNDLMQTALDAIMQQHAVEIDGEVAPFISLKRLLLASVSTDQHDTYPKRMAGVILDHLSDFVLCSQKVFGLFAQPVHGDVIAELIPIFWDLDGGKEED